MKVLLEVSARHVHLSIADFKRLFKADAELTVKRELSQTGQFLSNDKLDIISSKSNLSGVSILGPLRRETQVEISVTDSLKLGIEVPIRESGDLDGTPGCKLATQHGQINIKHGLIVPKRHVHLSLDSARKNGFENGQILSVKVNSNGRSLFFFDTVARVHKDFMDAIHIDTDEANAAGVKGGIFCEVEAI
ncbi:MAG: phosphate propanoyltransferase [Oscillospiraceae bacterium]|nr:phosphate propanoyltransferase [Oscillospiraceae bacterium]